MVDEIQVQSPQRSNSAIPEFGNPKVRTRGFTLIEMVVVISMILILLSIALPMYNQSVIRAREAKLQAESGDAQ